MDADEVDLLYESGFKQCVSEINTQIARTNLAQGID